MPRQRVTIAKIGGRAGARVAQQFERWSAARRSEDPDCWTTEDWPRSVHRSVSLWLARFDNLAAAPPILFYRQYIDLWSSGHLFTRWLGEPWTVRAKYILAESAEIQCYTLPDKGELTAELRKKLRWRSLPMEERWYAQALLDAVHAYERIVPTGAIVVIRGVLGPCIADDEIERLMSK